MSAPRPDTPGPRPGDRRHPGPTPPPGWRDHAWAGLAGAVAVVTAVQFVRLAVTLSRLDTGPSGAGALLGFVITVAWLLTAYWVVMGCWRRSVWGCPFAHTFDAGTDRCPRHAVVDDVTLPGDEG